MLAALGSWPKMLPAGPKMLQVSVLAAAPTMLQVSVLPSPQCCKSPCCQLCPKCFKFDGHRVPATAASMVCTYNPPSQVFNSGCQGWAGGLGLPAAAAGLGLQDCGLRTAA